MTRGPKAKDSFAFWKACSAAEALGIDTWPEYFARTRAGEDHWYALMRSEERSRIREVVELAEAMPPLSEIARGPGDAFGLGPEFESHLALDAILQDLENFPTLGWPPLEVGQSHVGIWPIQHALIERCHEDEPEERVEETFAKLLAGEPLDY